MPVVRHSERKFFPYNFIISLRGEKVNKKPKKQVKKLPKRELFCLKFVFGELNTAAVLCAAV